MPIRPLLLPQLVASRKSSLSHRDSMEPNVTVDTSCESLHSAATGSSDCSTPLTPTFSLTHKRYPSSNSSLGSSPPAHDPLESMSSSLRLPPLTKLTEEPLEREMKEQFNDNHPMVEEEDGYVPVCGCGLAECAHHTFSMASPFMSGRNLDDMTDAYFSDDADFNAIHVSKRRRSEDSTVNSISSRFESRLPSLSRHWKGRRISGLSMKTRSISSRAPSMERSTSQTHSARQSREHVASNYPLTPSQSDVQFPDYSMPSSPIDIVPQEVEIKEEPIDREGMASTPLLPPTMMSLRVPENTPMQSPLQSPTVADSGHFTFANSPGGTPRTNFGPPTPPLSKQPSYSSLSIAARNGPSASLAEIPRLDESDDEWSEKLGHANFTIEPAPYLPEICDAFSCRQLFRDWEQARCNFAKHQMRTAEHVGATSTTYKYSEQKWAQIDAKWKAYIAFSGAGITDEQITDSSPIEPAPLVRLPSLNSKFPGKGDEDIVGPMEVAPPQIQPRQARKSSFAKFFSFFGKSSTP